MERHGSWGLLEMCKQWGLECERSQMQERLMGGDGFAFLGMGLVRGWPGILWEGFNF